MCAHFQFAFGIRERITKVNLMGYGLWVRLRPIVHSDRVLYWTKSVYALCLTWCVFVADLSLFLHGSILGKDQHALFGLTSNGFFPQHSHFRGI